MTRSDLASRVTLTPMEPGRDEEFAQMLDEYRAEGEIHVYTGLFNIAWQGYKPFYDLLMQMKNGGAPTPEIVPMDAYFIEADGRMLGEIYIRHRLAPNLERIGVHIGYKVRPSCRKLGVATAALRLGLEKLRELGVESALVTCDAANAASARVIEKCGGARICDAILEDRVERRYRVPTAVAGA